MDKWTYTRTDEIKKKNSENREGKGKGICGKYIRTDEIKAKQSKKMMGHPPSERQKQVLREMFLGSRNPMNDPEIKASISGENSYRFGKPPVPGIVHLYQSPFQGIVKLNHRWELLFANYLDSIKEPWYHEYKTFRFTFNNKSSSYTPDFYLPNQDKYIEVKGRWIRDAKEKFEEFKKQHPEIKIELLMKKDLIKLGIKIK